MIRYARFLIILALPLSLILYACGGQTKEEKAEKEVQEAADKMEEAANQMRDALAGNNKSDKKEVVDWRKLKDLLPNKIEGMPRTNESGETAGAMGFNISQAEGTYEKDDRRINLHIVDTGGLSGLLNASAAWATITIDKEDRNGYERTTEIDGYKAFEKYNNNSKNAEINVLVGSRFIVTLEASGVEMKELRNAIDDIGLKKLEKLD
ncbi:MAG: hypothetical protein IPL49_06780 [Saprospirales bacterium]|nr:hypothetical protein [Saprospirales bacterium]MBK8490597.1 hypothetical protein [Saprospirales bacterium]